MKLSDTEGTYPRACKHDPAFLVESRRVNTWLATYADVARVAAVKELLQWKDDDAMEALATTIERLEIQTSP